DPQAKKERSQRLRALGQAKKRAFAQRFIGREIEILLEGKRDKARQLFSGLSTHYLRVYVEAPETLVNELIPVRVTGLDEDGVLGSMLPRQC
ncbi:MAG: tRNA (N(6)-L-threonylcarbamoyladenosine(37)-C(2))-methylthiotransferase MtaB, partial [Candidatus Entotheonellia bacterium]